MACADRSALFNNHSAQTSYGSGGMEDFLKTYRDPKFAGRLAETIKNLAPERRVKFVHVCGTA